MNKLRFGTYLAPNMLPVYEAIALEVGRALSIPTELVVETSYESCAEDINDVCFVCSLPYIMFERQEISPALPIAAPVLKGARYKNLPIYFSDVIVHKESPYVSFIDLRGSSWAYNEPLSQSGYGITRYHLVKIGETQGFFGNVVESGFHEKSIRMVANKEIDASVIDSQVLVVAMRDDPSLKNSLKIIDVLGPSTIQPIAVSKRLPTRLREDIRGVLFAMGDDPAYRGVLDKGFIDHFTPVEPSSYDDIRKMVRACEEAHFMTIK